VGKRFSHFTTAVKWRARTKRTDITQDSADRTQNPVCFESFSLIPHLLSTLRVMTAMN
jgi:hypothetical protein